MARVGRYEIERELGRGTMGVVYLARDPTLGRRVAVKSQELPSGFTSGQRSELQERFLREARAAAVLSHPAIVTVYDAAEDPERGSPFIAMEYVPGSTLQSRIERVGRLEPEQAFALAVTISEALDDAHAAGIVHRDLKPANILIRDSDGAVKIADFGIARLPESDLTRSGTTLGTPAYMSPEQVRGEPATASSDLFSLAVILYEALCGERPFTGDDLGTLTQAVALGTPVPVSRRVPSLPATIDDFFDRALAKDPAHRFPSGAAFRDGLKDVRSSWASGTRGLATVVAFARECRLESEGQCAADDGAPGGESLTSRSQSTEGLDTWFNARAGRRRKRKAALESLAPIGAIAVVAALVLIGALWFQRGEKASQDRLSSRAAIDGAPVEPRGDRALSGGAPRESFAPPGGAAESGRVITSVANTAAARRAVLKVSVKSRIPAGKLWLTVDQDRVYSHALAAPAGSRKFLNRLRGRELETFETPVSVSAGKHLIAAAVRISPDGAQYEATARVELKPGETRIVHIVAGRAVGAPVSLKVD